MGTSFFNMRRAGCVAMLLFFSLCGYAQVDFKKIDRDFFLGVNAQQNITALEEMLKGVNDSKSRAEVYWRLSRNYLIVGEGQKDKESRRATFAKGVDYAQAGIKADNRNPRCYMWHCANTGRWCQTKSLMKQASSVPVMVKDLEIIIDSLGVIDYSEAWNALAELYFHHPFKSDDAAVNFMRRAIETIPAGETRISCYLFFANMLLKRDFSRAQRVKEIEQSAGKFKAAKKSSIERYSYYCGKLGYEYKPVWSAKYISIISDKEEAASVVKYAMSLYENSSNRGKNDTDSYKELQKLNEKINK